MKWHKKNQQDEFIQLLEIHCKKTENPNLLKQIVDSRKTTISRKLIESNQGNLAHIFSTDIAFNIIGKIPCSTLPQHYFVIEQLAQKLFGCLLTCWTEFEIFRTIQNSALSNKHTNQFQTTASSVIHEDYHYELVRDISQDQRYFYTEFTDQPLLLSDAIVLINIATFIKQHKWYEMLNLLDVSSKGEHFILYQMDEQIKKPMIISSALIEHYQDKENWLFFDSFFLTEQWNKYDITPSLQHFSPQLKSRLTLSKNKNTMMCSSVLENAIYSSIVDKKRVCGVIRFTINGPKRKLNHFLYLAQKGLANALYNSGRDMIFSIIEQPAMILFYQAMNSIETEHMPFIFTSSQDINSSGLITYKGICLTKNASYVFNQYDFKEYNVKIIQRRKELIQQ